MSISPATTEDSRKPELPNPSKNTAYQRKTDSPDQELKPTKCFYCGKPLMRKHIRRRPSCEECQTAGKAKRWRLDHAKQLVEESIGRPIPEVAVPRITESLLAIDPASLDSLTTARDRLVAQRMDALSDRDDAIYRIQRTSDQINALNVLIAMNEPSADNDAPSPLTLITKEAIRVNPDTDEFTGPKLARITKALDQ